MRDIFFPVVVWLGLEGDGSEIVMEGIKKSRTPGFHTSDQDIWEVPRSALISFLTRAWCTRVWIVQELMVSGMPWFLCGKSFETVLNTFMFLTNVLRYLDKQSYYITDTGFRDLLSWRFYFILLYERWEKEMSLPLLELIELTHDAGATDPRDRIFALLGLVGPKESFQLKPDYKLSPCEVFCSAIRAMANEPNDAERSAKVMKAVAEWRPWSYRTTTVIEGHWPLKERVPEREQCDGIACSSRYLCLKLPGLVKPDAACVVQYFIMGL